MDTAAPRPPGQDLVGRRLSVRSRLPDGSATDVVGRLLAAGDTLRLERRDGSVATVEAATILIWRVVPDRPVRSQRPTAVPVEQLARVMTRSWPPIESEPLGAWELRASGGFTKRANSAAAPVDPGVPLGDALDGVTAFYRARDLHPLIQVTADSEVEKHVRAVGWAVVPGGDALALVARLDRRWPADPDVTFSPTADDAWLALHGRPDGSPEAARAVLEGPATVAHARLGDAICRVAVTGEWAGFAALRVPERQRRAGVAQRLMTACLGWAVAHGADKAHLQVEVDNEAALRLYQRFGFVDHHGYRYLAPQPATS